MPRQPFPVCSRTGVGRMPSGPDGSHAGSGSPDDRRNFDAFALWDCGVIRGSDRSPADETGQTKVIKSLSSRRAAASPPPEIPDHEVLRCIGRGTFGEVWLARNVMAEYRAVKVVRRDWFEDDRTYEREFEGIRKFEPVSRRHEALLDVLHAGRNDNDGYYYYVMELADNDAGAPPSKPGSAQSADMADTPAAAPVFIPADQVIDPNAYLPRTLRQVLKSRGRLPARECVELGLSLATGLEHLHRHGLVHRDIKPDNIIFVRDIPKLADIGLVAKPDAGLTIIGTEGYMAPESPASFQADLYSLGKVLYEILVHKRATEYPDPLTNLHELPDREEILELQEVIAKACAFDPKQRYASASEMKSDLTLLRAGRSVKRVRRLERRWARAKRVMLLMAGLMVAGGFVAFARIDAAKEKANAELKLRELEERQVFLQNAAGEVLGSTTAGWSSRAWQQIRRAKLIRVDHELKYQASAVLSGLDAHPVGIRVPKAGVPASWAAFHPDGKRLLVSGRRSRVAVWSGEDGDAPVWFMRAGIGPVAFRSDGTAVQLQRTESGLRLWDLEAAEVLTEVAVPDHVPPARAGETSDDPELLLRLTCDGAVAAALFRSQNRDVVAVWNASSGGSLKTFECAKASALTLADDGSVVAVGDEEGGIRVWSVADGAVVAELAAERAKGGLPIRGLALRRDVRSVGGSDRRPDWLLAAGESGGGISIRSLSGERMPVRLYGAAYDVYSLAFSPDGMTLSSAGRGRTKIWDVATGRMLVFLDSGDYTYGLSYSADGKRLAICSEGTESSPSSFGVWQLQNGRGVKTLRGLTAQINKVSFSADGRWVAGLAQNWEVGVWNTETGHLARLMSAPIGLLADNAALGFSPDAGRLTCVTGEEARIWDLAGGGVVKSVSLPRGLADGLMITGDGAAMALRMETRDGATPERSRWFAPAAEDPRVCRIRNLLGENPESATRTITDFDRGVLGLLAVPKLHCFVLEGWGTRGDEPARLLGAFDAGTGAPLWPPRRLEKTNDYAGFHTFTDTTGTYLFTSLTNDVMSVLDLATGEIVDASGWNRPRNTTAISADGELWVGPSPGLSQRGWSIFRRTGNGPLVTVDGHAGAHRDTVGFDSAGRFLTWENGDGTLSLCDLNEVRRRFAAEKLGNE